MNTIFTNAENSKTSDFHRLLLTLSDKINLKSSDVYVALSKPSIYYPWKYEKNHTKTVNLQHQLQLQMKTLIYLRNHILYQIFKIISIVSLENIKQWLMILQ